jgi:hypothetical protein
MTVPQAEKTVPGCNGSNGTKSPLTTEGLKLKGVLDAYESFSVTPVIGTEFPDANVAEWMKAEQSDELIRDLAITSKTSIFACLTAYS